MSSLRACYVYGPTGEIVFWVAWELHGHAAQRVGDLERNVPSKLSGSEVAHTHKKKTYTHTAHEIL